jgi:peptidyl-prolyl cis-trans isomerase D
MLDFFRQKGLSNVLYGVIIAGTILTFVLGFRPNASMKTASIKEVCAARVRGRCIDPKDFNEAYRMLMPSRSAEASRRLNLKRVALDGLIERELLDDEARRLGIAVTDAEVTDQLYAGYVRASVPAADPTVAQQVLQEMYQSYARAGIIPSEIAQAHFNDRDTAIPIDFRDAKSHVFDMKVYERKVRGLSNRSTEEFRDGQAREMLAAKMRDIVRDPVRVSEGEALEEYKRRYETATLTWLPVKEAWAARWAVDAKPAAVDAWVKAHQAEFDTALAEHVKEDAPQAGHIRHILVKTPYGASDEEKSLAVAKLAWAAARIRAGDSFAEVAREVSEDPGSASKGGDVGDQTDGFVPSFRFVANAVRPGEISPATETQYGFHLITKDDPARDAEIAAAVKRTLARSMFAKDGATETALGVAKKIDEAMRGGLAAADAVRTVIAPYVRAERVEPIRVLLAPPPPTADAGAPTGPPPPLPPRKFDASTDPDGPQPQTSTAFNRGGDPFPGLSPDGSTAVVNFAFGPTVKDDDVMADPVRTPDAYVVVQLKQHKTATPEEFAKDRDTFVVELLRAKRDEALALYVRRLRQAAKTDIKIDESFVQEVKTDGGAGSASDEEDEY